MESAGKRGYKAENEGLGKDGMGSIPSFQAGGIEVFQLLLFRVGAEAWISAWLEPRSCHAFAYDYKGDFGALPMAGSGAAATLQWGPGDTLINGGSIYQASRLPPETPKAQAAVRPIPITSC